jgi:outer membrane protein OmpA-like peptidoglycan-associated protein
MRTGTLFSFSAVGALAALSVLTTSRSSNAQSASYAIDPYEPAERGSDWLSADSLDLRGTVRPSFGITADYSYRQLSIRNPDESLGTAVVRNFFVIDPGASLVLFDRLRLGLNVPVLLLGDGTTATLGSATLPAPTVGQALGDIRLGADVRLIGVYGDPFTAAIGAQVWLPTGDQGAYMSDSQTRVMPRVQVAGDVGPIAYSARVGWQFRGAGAGAAGYLVGSELTTGAAVGVRLADRMVLIGPEVYGSTVTDHGESFVRDASIFEGLIGGHLFLSNGLRFGLSAGAGLTGGPGTAFTRELLSVEWSPPVNSAPSDRDHDGIPDAEDACPDVPGVRTDDPKTNGCPPPLADRDHDGIPDAEDACPDVPGVRTDDPKTNGCPPDRDHDGIPDAEDACPDVPGVRTDDPKTNGCPPDRDHDGIPDAEDACPDVPGVRTDDPKTNGCPPPPADRDHDGIPDAEDACPDEPGVRTDDPKTNGCPKAFVREGQIVITDQVKFKTSSAEILPGRDSLDVLEAVQKVLVDHPEIRHVRVEGHTDDRGNANINKPLSARRAASVVTWLTQHGIDAKRLGSAGFGADRPIAPNTTEDGRRLNRRVEFHIESK